MIDLSKTIEAKSDQLNADDLVGGEITIKITKVTGSDSKEQPISIYYEGDNGKPWKPCKTMRRVICHIWGIYSDKYIGQKLTLYRDASVTFGGMEVGGIRISHATGIDKNAVIILAAKKKTNKPVTIKPLIEVQQEPQKQPAQQPQQAFIMDDKFLSDGDDAALKGTAGYVLWWNNLTREQKLATKTPNASGEIEHQKWQQMAASVDAVAQSQQTEA